MGYGRGYGYGYGNMMGGGGWFFGLIMLLFWALVIVGIVLLVMWAVRSSNRHNHPGTSAPPQVGQAGHDEAVAIAKKRLASGEITPEEYDGIMRALGSG